jgi:fermentation-respiration switch protein FrsA (DUF1100 family)
VPPTPPRTPVPAGRAAGRRGHAERDPGEDARALRRRRLLALSLVAFVAVGVALSVALATGGSSRRHPAPGRTAPGRSATPASTPANASRRSSFAVGLRTLRLVDRTRTVTLPSGVSEPRTLVTYVRYPALGSPGSTDLPGAPAARGDGPFPLVIFGHGFAVTPALYARLLQSWARAGYIVAAPAFPLENANAPGGPDESDLSNQPGDMRFLITRMLAQSAGSGPFAGLIDPARIAVSGQSDGGDTALAVAYDSAFRDPRVDAAVILSGARIPTTPGFTFAPGSPPLLATQGTADTVNPPSFTEAFFQAARAPKYLLRLPGAEHLPPYTTQQPQLSVIERVSIAFLDAYLKHSARALARLPSLGSVPGVATLIAQP